MRKALKIGTAVLTCLAFLGLGLAVGVFWHGWAHPTPLEALASAGDQGESDAGGEEQVRWWTCSMHPQVRQPEPGRCPICAMDLIPVEEGAGAGKRVLAVSEEAAALMEIRTTPVERRFVENTIRMVGKVTYDETRLSHITAWVGGRLDGLYVDYTGIEVRAGDHMVQLYSPELISAQEELLQAIRAREALGENALEAVRASAGATVEAAREKLRLLGLKPDQLREVEERGRIAEHVTIRAPVGGTVTAIHAREGDYVTTGTRIYTTADLSRVWVRLDAYEQDLQWLRHGQAVTFTSEAHPGETFSGRIAFIDPVLDEETRTVRVRVNVPNPGRKLKPGMFVHGMVRARVGSGGKVMGPALADKWVCPMHPEVLEERPGECDVCGMDLVRAESLGYASARAQEAPLVIPASAPLITGKRAVVYVKVRNADEPTFEGRTVRLGPRAGDYYLVRGGLREGELVVTNGNFKIDSALQIKARPSMMSPDQAPPGHMAEHAHAATPETPDALPAPAQFRAKVGALWGAYRSLHEALAGDDGQEAAAAIAALREALGAVEPELLTSEPARREWSRLAAELAEPREQMAAAGSELAAIRQHLPALTDALAATLAAFGPQGVGPVYWMHCPMAFDGTGADWLQGDKQVRNPYYGASMLTCGKATEQVSIGSRAGDSRQ